MEDENYRKIKMMVENSIGATWVGCQERLFGRLMAVTASSWVLVFGTLLVETPIKNALLGTLFGLTALTLWQYTDLRKASAGFNANESRRTIPDRAFISSTAQRIAADLEGLDEDR